MSEHIVKAPNVPPFVTFVTSAVPMVFDNSLSYYEALCALWKWLQDDVVNVINNNATVTEDYINLTNELKTFVEDYFDNLDVQEEINNKLDQMAEDGSLQEILTPIVTQYIQTKVAWSFDNVAAMKASTDLVNNSYAHTLGFHSINDGGSAVYHIEATNESEDGGSIITLGSGLQAHLIMSDYVTPEMFGAYGDNTHDDTIALQNAINANGKVTLGKKVYSVKNVSITSSKDIHLKGNGTTIRCNRTIWNDIKDTPEGSVMHNSYLEETIANVTIEGIKFDGNCSNAATDITVTNHNFNILDIKNSQNVTIKDCVFTNSYQGALGLSGIKNGVITGNIIYSCGKGAITSLILQRNAINLRGYYFNRQTSQNVYLTDTKYTIKNNQIYDIVDECFMLGGVKDCTIENNEIHSIGQYIVEVFSNNTNEEDKTLLVLNNAINGNGSTVFNFNDSYQINGTLKFDCIGNDLLNIGAFKDYRNQNGKHYISNVNDYATLIIHLTNDAGMIARFENNNISLEENIAHVFAKLTCEAYFVNNDMNLTSLTSPFINDSHKPLHLIGNHIYADDAPETRYTLFSIYKNSEIMNNIITVPIRADVIRMMELDVKIQNNRIVDNPETLSNYHTVVSNRSTDGDYVLISGNIIEDINLLVDSNLSTARGTCLISGNILNISSVGVNGKFTSLSKQGNYPTNLND